MKHKQICIRCGKTWYCSGDGDCGSDTHTKCQCKKCFTKNNTKKRVMQVKKCCFPKIIIKEKVEFT